MTTTTIRQLVITGRIVPLHTAPNSMFNISTRLVGGIRFLKIGRFCFSFCVTRQYRAFN